MKKFFTCVIISLLIASFSVLEVSASVANMRNRQEELRRNIANLQGQLATTRTERELAVAEMELIDLDLTIASEELDFITEELEKTTALLEQTTIELELAEQDREAQFEALKGRIRFMSENGVTGYFQILFRSASISDFLNRVYNINQIIEYDGNRLRRLQETENLISTKRDDVSRHKRETEVLKAQQENKKADLEDAKFRKEELIAQLNRDETRQLQQIQNFDAETRRIDQEIRAALAAEAAARAEAARRAVVPVVYTGGRIAWPVPSSHRISSPYGNRINPITRRREMHWGIDVGAAHGANIVAAEGGRVISAGWRSGYGNTVMINHGNGLTTLYAHASRLLVSSGDTVVRGQVIARIGSTGQSTGPHLHFEVALNGVRQNPVSFVR